MKHLNQDNMKETAVKWLIQELNLYAYMRQIKQAKEMAEQELKDAYKHGRDDENCALSDGAMAPDYENADEWYQGEYGGEK